MRRALLDTGFLVALLDRSDVSHPSCVTAYQEIESELLTTEPVLTEAVYLLGPAYDRQRACLEFILQQGATLVPQSLESLARASALMSKYSDIPMDFADATLVVLAEDTGLDTVLTLDRRGFGAYRIHRQRGFRLIPDPDRC